MFYTYAHYRADDDRLFYIGKGKGNRYLSHSSQRSIYWQRVVTKHGYKAQILARWETEQEAFSHEVLLIDTFRSMGYVLVNMTAGGEGTSGVKLSDSAKQRLREVNLGKMYSEESKNKRRIAMTGRAVSETTRKRMSESFKGRKLSPEHVEIIRRSNTGRKHSAETIEKLKEIRKTKVFTSETRAKMSASLKGRVISQETKLKLAIARTGTSNPHRWKKVFCETNGMVYESLTAAAKSLSVDKSSISSVCRGKHTHTKGYVFRYVEH